MKSIIVLIISIIAYAYYIYSFPVSFYNDDSLFLARGILEFSVIDFSPHFPGYVSLIILGKFINFFINDENLSLFILTSFSSILIPLAIYLYVKKIVNEKVAFISFFLILTSPYLVNFSLSMISDSFGFLFLIVSMYLIEEKKFKTSGVFLSIAFFARPSYLIFYLTGLIYLYIKNRDSLKSIIYTFILTSIFFLGFIYITNGNLYLIEAKRFIVGHFTIWGSGQFSSHTWLGNIFSFENIPFILLLFCFPLKKEFLFLYSLFITYLLWIIFAQNPENLRHLIPIIFFASIFIAKQFEKKIYIFPLIILFNLSITLSYSQKESPLEQIIQELDNTKNVVVSNRGIEILRDKDFVVLDKFYKNKVKVFEKKKDLIFLSADENEYKNTEGFSGRFLGERELYFKEK